MLWKICLIYGNETTAFAARELKRYLSAIDASADMVLLRMTAYDAKIDHALWVGQDPAFADFLPVLPDGGDPLYDDGLLIDVTGNQGIISGLNPRSVLLAVYRFLTELGCAWVRPGADGEMVPRRNLGADRVVVCERPSYRHRSMEIEGANAYDHVESLIEWIPKLGMNGLLIPFFAPFAIYDRWYSHRGNPHYESTPVTMDETKWMVKEHVAQIKKRGLLYHAIGHGWTNEALGIDSNDWNVSEQKIPDAYRDYYAMIDGKRGFFAGVPMLSNLCFSNTEARDKVSSFVVEYCGKNPEIDYLHFWLSDSYNSHCECERCKDTLPSDYYVMMLNEIDEKLTRAGLRTKLVFLLYFDLLWEPQKERLRNPDRFVMMFAPFSRTYSKTYSESDLSGNALLAPYVRNQLTLPRGVEENVAHLRRWQAQFQGDSFIFDYHFFADHFKDPGNAQISRVLFEDIANLDALGLNGTVNCQITRPFFPTALGLSLMAKALWNKNASFDREADAFYLAAFGEEGLRVRRYLEQLSVLFDPPYLRHEKVQIDEAAAERLKGIEGLINDFDKMTSAVNEPCANKRRSWAHLRLHGQLCGLFAKALVLKAQGKHEEAMTVYADVESWARLHDRELSKVLDFYSLTRGWKSVVEGYEPTFIK